MSFNLDPTLFATSSSSKIPDLTRIKMFHDYHEKNEMTKVAIMSKPVMNIEKRKLKPLVYEAVAITVDNILAVRKWAVGAKLHGYDGSPSARYLVLAGGQTARQGDYVVQLLDGRFMAVKKDTFEAMSSLVGFTPKYEGK